MCEISPNLGGSSLRVMVKIIPHQRYGLNTRSISKLMGQIPVN